MQMNADIFIMTNNGALLDDNTEHTFVYTFD